MDLKDTDLLALKATQRRRDKIGDDASSDSSPAPAAPAPATMDQATFTKAGSKPTGAKKAASASRLSELLRKRDADSATYAAAWDEAK